MRIVVEPGLSRETLQSKGVFDWPIWTKEPSRFPWTYQTSEICYLLEGDVTVTPEGGEPVRIGEGDLVTFPRGMFAEWEIHQAVRKHYTFD